MLFVLLMLVSIYTVFVPVFAGRKHFLIGITLFSILMFLALVTKAAGLS